MTPKKPIHYCGTPSDPSVKHWRCPKCGARFKRSHLVGRLFGKWLMTKDGKTDE